MSEYTYYIWSATLGGWALKSGAYGSELSEAQEFTRDQALRRCILGYSKAMEEFRNIPVLIADAKEIKG